MSAIRVLTRISNLKALKWAPMDTSGCHIFQGSGRWQGIKVSELTIFTRYKLFTNLDYMNAM